MSTDFPSSSLGGSQFSFLLAGSGFALLIVVSSDNSTNLALAADLSMSVILTGSGLSLILLGIIVGVIDWRLNRKHKKAKINQLQDEPTGDRATDVDEDMDRDRVDYDDGAGEEEREVMANGS